MNWDSLLKTVKDIAPTLVGMAGTAIGGPAVGGILGSLAKAVSGKGDLEEAASELLADPNKMLEFRSRARDAELKELELRTKDVQDARKTLVVSKGAIWVSVMVVLSYISAMLLAMLYEIPEGSQNLSYLMLGNLGTGFGMVLTFWLGSSSGSKEKDATMAKYADAAKADQEARKQRRAGQPKSAPPSAFEDFED